MTKANSLRTGLCGKPLRRESIRTTSFIEYMCSEFEQRYGGYEAVEFKLGGSPMRENLRTEDIFI
jgi:hypothetical protein